LKRVALFTLSLRRIAEACVDFTANFQTYNEEEDPHQTVVDPE
jgi:hypothetical protein